MAGEDEVTDGDAMSAGCGDGGCVLGDGVVVEALVEGVGHFGGVADQQCVFAGGGVGLGRRPGRRRPW